MKFIGDISNTELSKVLEKLKNNGYIGTLIVSEGNVRKEFYFDGPQNLVSEATMAHRFKLGEIILSYGRITQEHIDYVVQLQPKNEKMFGLHLLELGYCTQNDLDDALRAQIQDDFLEIVGLEGAEYEFIPDQKAPETPPTTGLYSSVLMDLNVFFETVQKRLEAWQSISEHIPTLRCVYKIHKRDAITEDMRQGDFKKILQLCDGRNRILDIAQLSKISPYDICTILHSLTSSEVVRQANFDEVMGVVQIFESTNRNEKAVAFLEYAAQLEPDNVEIVEKLARNFEEAKDVKKAAKYYAEMAKTRKRELNMPEFEQHIKKAISLDKKEPSHRQVLIQYFLEREKLEEAAETARQLAGLYFEMEAHEAAENLCELFFDKDEYSVEFRKMLINHYLHIKEKGKVIEQYEKLIELANDDKQKMEYYQKILSVDPSLVDVRKKMSTLAMKRTFEQYKWLIIGLGTVFILLSVLVFYSRSSANSQFQTCKEFLKAPSLRNFEIAKQKFGEIRNNFWVGKDVRQELEAIELAKIQLEQEISYRSYQNEIKPLRALLSLPENPKTVVTEAILKGKAQSLSLNTIVQAEEIARKKHLNLSEHFEKGDLESGKNKMISAVWKNYQKELELTLRILADERLGRTSRDKKDALDRAELDVQEAYAAINTKNKEKIPVIQEKLNNETKPKLYEAKEKCESSDPYFKRFEDKLNEITEIEQKFVVIMKGDDEAIAKSLIENANSWGDPSGAGDLKKAIEMYQKALKEIPKLKNLENRNRQAYIENAEKGLKRSEEELNKLINYTLVYQENLSRNFDSLSHNQREEALQQAYSMLLKLLNDRWFEYWQEQLRQEKKPLMAFHWIDTSPAHSFVYVNEELVGRAPRLHRFSLNEFPVYRAHFEGFTPFSSTIPEDKPWSVVLKLEKLPLWIYSKFQKSHDFTPGILQEQNLLFQQAAELANLEIQNPPIAPTLAQNNKSILKNVDSYGTPILVEDDKFAYFCSLSGIVYKVDRASNLQNSLQIQGKNIKIPYGNSMAIFDGKLYIATNKGVAVIETRGNELKQIDFWNTPGSLNSVFTGILITQGRIYFGCEDQNIYSFKIGSKGIDTNSKIIFKADGAIWATPHTYDRHILVTSKSNIYCLDGELNKIWSFNTELRSNDGEIITKGTVFRAPVVVAADSDNDVRGRVFAVDEDGDFFCLNLKTGKLFWRGTFDTASTRGVKGTPALVNSVVYCGTEDGRIIAKNLFDKNGKEFLFQYDNQEGFRSSPLYLPSKKLILFFDLKSRIIAFEP